MQIKIQWLPVFVAMLASLVFSTPLLAAKNEQLQQADFMFAAQLDDAPTSLRKLELDASVLQHMQTPELFDVRVFDARGQIVPALVRRTAQDVDVSEHSLNFFPLYGDKDRDVRLSSTDVERNEAGLVVAIHSQQSQADQQAILTGYVIDQTAYEKERLSELEFEWQNHDLQVMISLRVETSDDLSNWVTLERAAVIAHFQIDKQVMRRNAIKLSAHAQRYLRLTLLTPVEDFVLEKVTARYNTPVQTDYSWLSLGQPQAVTVNGLEQYEFVMPGRVVPALVKFSFTGNEVVVPGMTNGLISGQLYSLSAQHKWIRRQAITQYRIVLAEGELESDPLRLGSNSDRRWRFEPADGQRVLDPHLPEIKLGYAKYELVFMAQGQAPFTLAWGNAEAERQPSSLNAILTAASAADIAEVRIQSAEQLGEIPQVHDEHYIDWKKWLLFAVLLTAVLAAGRMAYQLFREMNA